MGQLTGGPGQVLRRTVAVQDEKVSFHVISVEEGDATDYCTTGKCYATRFAVAISEKRRVWILVGPTGQN